MNNKIIISIIVLAVILGGVIFWDQQSGNVSEISGAFSASTVIVAWNAVLLRGKRI